MTTHSDTRTTAGDIMTRDVVTISPDNSIGTAALTMRVHDIGALPVVDDRGRLLGLITDRDIVIHGVADEADPANTRVDALGLSLPRTVADDVELATVHEVMRSARVRRLPVVRGRDLVGMISISDLVRHSPGAEILQTEEILLA